MNDASPNTRLAGNTPNPTSAPATGLASATASAGSPRPAVLSLAIKEKAALYAAYMPYLKNGGIFVPTTRVYQLGDEVYLILTLMDDPTKIPVAGKVIWVSPAGGGARQPGIGVHFPSDETGLNARKRIEEILGSALKSARPTHTL
ncbi:MAG TPA: PilZ domain-containing protein [Burkholderiaceae bacterium]|nr:PilZ domain-containing protein [Burkholderiaceae bacterium]